MKRMTAVFLSLVLLLCTCFASAEEAEPKAQLGTISINGVFALQCTVPDGYKPVPIESSAERNITILQSEDPEAPIMYLSIAYDETYSDVERMNDLDDEALALLEQTYIQEDPGIEIYYGETGYGTLVMIARHDSDTVDYVSFLSVYKGYFVEFVLIASETASDRNLTEDQIMKCVAFLTELDFIPAGSSPAGTQRTFTAVIGDYDAESHQLKVTLKTPARVRASYLEENLKEGATVEIAGETVQVESISSDEYYAYIINDDYLLEKEDDEWYQVYQYDTPVLVVDSDTVCTVTEDTVFVDNIDPESGDLTEEPVLHTFAEFLEIREKEANGIGPGFDIDNTQVTLDADGNLMMIERIFVPWM